jgi:hypothetical protein
VAEENRNKEVLIWALLGVAAFPLAPLFDYLGEPQLARPVPFVLMAMFISVRICWNLHDRPQFWLAIAAIVAVHAILVLCFAQILSRTPFGIWLCFGYLDTFAVILLMNRVFGTSERQIDRKS